VTSSIRGNVAIIGIGETQHVRNWPGRTHNGLLAEAASMAIKDAGLRQQDVDGVLTFGGTVAPATVAEYLGLKNVTFSCGVTMFGASNGVAAMVAAAALECGYCNYALFVAGGGRDTVWLRETRGMTPSPRTEFDGLYGSAVAANNGYGLCYTRHMYEYGTKPEQMARMAVDERFNTMNNPRSAFRSQGLITVEDVMNSRYINYPLHLLECVMPIAGAACYIMTTADRAKVAPKKPVYMLGNGFYQGSSTSWQGHDVFNDITLMATERGAKRAYVMSGYGPNDVDVVECYD